MAWRERGRRRAGEDLDRGRAMRWCRTAAAAAALCSGGPPATLRAQPTAGDHVLIVTGASGAPEYAASFQRTATTLLDAMRAAGVPAANVAWLSEDPATTGGRATGRSGRDDVQRALKSLADALKPGDRLLLVLVGHGSHEGADARINLPGPDLTAAELKDALAPMRGVRVAVVNAASASGDFVPVLAADGRIVVTSTKSSLERNETRFAEHFADAYAGGGADADKDGRVSLLEAFVYARREVVRAYERERLLLTEHAVLDDDGDGKGSAEPAGTTGDGRLARAFVLGTRAVASTGGATVPATGNARQQALGARRDSLQRAVEELRARKDATAPAAYEAELERLLLALAETTQQLRAAQGAGASGSPAARADSTRRPPTARP